MAEEISGWEVVRRDRSGSACLESGDPGCGGDRGELP